MAAKWQKTLDDLLYNGDLDGAYNLLDGILRDNTNDINARVAFGRVQYEQGDPDNARNTFETVLNISPSNGDALKGKAEVSELLGDYEEAIHCYQRATQSMPRDVEAWKSLGILLSKLKKFTDLGFTFEGISIAWTDVKHSFKGISCVIWVSLFILDSSECYSGIDIVGIIPQNSVQ
jgi:tetratricopeptide (TPR) repeat protein